MLNVVTENIPFEVNLGTRNRLSEKLTLYQVVLQLKRS